MQPARTYRQERTGQLNHWLTFYTPVFTRTATGGDRVQWVEWRTCKGKVVNLSGNEAVDADRPVAVNSKRFTIRTLSTPGINETMMLMHGGQYYLIKRLDKSEELPRNAYTEITATRRDESPTTVDVIVGPNEGQVYLSFAQALAAQSGNYVTVTAGTLLSTADHTVQELHLLLDVYRSTQRMTYNSPDGDGFTIDNATNRINFNFPLSGENVLVRQYGVI
jgi:head-tail adaptor